MTDATLKQEFTSCSCCGKQVPTHQIELYFHKPDAFLRIPPEDRMHKTGGNDDVCIIQGEGDSQDRFFVRSLLPLFVKDWDAPYSLGVWIEVAGPDFDRIYDLWDDENQASEPAFPAKLANHIPLHLHSYGMAGHLYLIGPTTRPTFQLSEADCALFEEQSKGISAHRASEYAALVHKPVD